MKKDSFHCLISNNEFPQFVGIEVHRYVHLNDGSSVEVSPAVCHDLLRQHEHDCTSSFKLMCSDFGHLVYLVTYFFTFEDMTQNIVDLYCRLNDEPSASPVGTCGNEEGEDNDPEL